MLLVACGGGPDRGVYVAANEALLAAFPPLPGAVEVSRESMSYTFQDGGLFDSPEGYGTRVTYQVPQGVLPDDVANHYLRVAGSSWQHKVEFTLMLCRGDSLVAVDMANVAANRTYDVYVDHSYAEEGIRTAGCE
ncbi:MAG TPA: hypothetical protein VI876_07490 [Dehalococcoidia bacterium]|nr:hypothetical protein [Dehalococcoidia bacterium]